MIQLLLAVIYLAFISLGLPDSLLGSAWPIMHEQLHVPLSYAGVISIIIACGTVISSLASDRLTHRLGTGKVTAVSVALTALALFGFSISDQFWQLCLWAVPYGLGAGSVDASLNNYVALHYESRHMSWLHCMWGVGAATGPYIMGYALSGGNGWHVGYGMIAIIQIVLTIILFLSLPLWKNNKGENGNEAVSEHQTLSFREILSIPGAKEVMVCFFCYCAVEQTCGLWASSYLNLAEGIYEAKAASFAGMFYIGITVGRAISGFLTMKLNDRNMIRLGQVIIFIGLLIVLVSGKELLSVAGLVMIGLGCAPIYPCIIHSTPYHFGKERSQALIGVQMASAYVGIMVMPPLFGLIANHISITLYPVYLLCLTVLMTVMSERLNRKTEK